MGLNVGVVREGPVMIGMFEHVTSQARAGGVTSDSTAGEIVHGQDPGLVSGWRVCVAGARGCPREVAKPHRLVWNIHCMLDRTRSGGGDVRRLQDETKTLTVLWGKP